MTNNFIEEIKIKNYEIEIKNEEILFKKDGKETKLTMDKIRKIFLDSLVVYLDNID